jgi:hypothetical protein
MQYSCRMTKRVGYNQLKHQLDRAMCVTILFAQNDIVFLNIT